MDCWTVGASEGRRLRSGVVDDDESRAGRLLTRLAHAALLSRPGKHSRSAEVVDSRLKEAGLQCQTQDLLGL